MERKKDGFKEKGAIARTSTKGGQSPSQKSPERILVSSEIFQGGVYGHLKKKKPSSCRVIFTVICLKILVSSFALLSACPRVAEVSF